MEKEICAWFVFNSGQVLIEKKKTAITSRQAQNRRYMFLSAAPFIPSAGWVAHGQDLCHPCTVSGDEESPRMMKDLRASFDVLPREEYDMAGKASQILNWDKNSRYCPMCGVPTVQVSPIAKRCPECRQEFYPRISPAVIVLIKKEDSILLVHARNFRGTFKGLVAGFLEPGETLEECVHREVMEETGLRIRNLKYFGSQPWPYPSGIMVGYTAEYESGSIKLQDEELSAGAFYTREQLPRYPKN